MSFTFTTTTINKDGVTCLHLKVVWVVCRELMRFASPLIAHSIRYTCARKKWLWVRQNGMSTAHHTLCENKLKFGMIVSISNRKNLCLLLPMGTPSVLKDYLRWLFGHLKVGKHDEKPNFSTSFSPSHDFRTPHLKVRTKL